MIIIVVAGSEVKICFGLNCECDVAAVASVCNC